MLIVNRRLPSQRMRLATALIILALTTLVGGVSSGGATVQRGLRPTALTMPDGSRHTLNIPAGMTISLYARGLSGPRFMALGPQGDVLIAERDAGRLSVLLNRRGGVAATGVVHLLDGLDTPHGVAYSAGRVYVGEQGQVSVMRYDPAKPRVTGRTVIVGGLPTGAGHSTRTVTIGPDGMLYVSVGSSCNVCIESDWRRATVVRYRADGSGGALFARGLRNSVGLAWQPGSKLLWATENGRDDLGDNIPPDEINIIRRGADYGWPYCWGDRRQDPDVGQPCYCARTTPPTVALQAHSAPLGLAFYTGTALPPHYRGGLFVAFHGSWNRSQPTGYKLVYIPVSGARAGTVEDVVTGWVPASASNGPDQSWGRPVDVLVAPDGSLLISDDKAGVVYRLAATPKRTT